MRDSLTLLAIALIAVLTAALAGPWLVDWSAQRGFIEARLTEALGVPARIRGGIDLKLLPSPYFVVEAIEIGGKAGDGAPGFALSASTLRLELAPASLLRGEVEFVEARLEAPRLALALSPDGAVPLALPEAGVARRFRFQKIIIANGSLSVADAQGARRLEVDAIDLEAGADSLTGPFKAKGALGTGDGRTRFRFATGPLEQSGLSLKLFADAAASHPSAELDGRLDLSPGAQRFAGAAKFVGADPLWRASGRLALDADAAILTEIELRVGEEAQALNAKGEAAFAFSSPPKASATLSSDEVDLDAWRAADRGGAFAALIPAALQMPPLTLTWGARTLSLGGARFSDVSISLVQARRAPAASDQPPPAWLRIEAQGPGRSHVLLDGQGRIGAGPGFEGDVQASAEDARWLKGWLSALAPQWAPRTLPFSAFDLTARTALSPAAISLRDLVAAIDGGHVSGRLDYRLASASGPARLDADLVAPSLDLDAAAAFDPGSLLARAFGDSDGSLRLATRALTLRRDNGPADPIGALTLNVARSGESFDLSELTFAGRDGAGIAASGHFSRAGAHVEAKLLGPPASGLAPLLVSLAPEPAARLLRPRAGLLTPIDLRLSAEAARQGSAFTVTALTARGSIAGATLEASVKADAKQPGVMTVAALAQAKDSLPLLRLLGLAGAPATARGSAQIEIKAQGAQGGAAQTSIKAALGDAAFSFDGEVATDLDAPAAKGAVRFSSPDSAVLLRAAGLAFADFTARLPVAASGELVWSKAGFSLEKLNADIAGTALSGALDFGGQAPGRLRGSLALDRWPASALFGLLLGAPEPAKAGSLWSSLVFAPAAFELPNASIALAVREMPLPAPAFPRAISAKNVRASLMTAPGRIELRDLGCDIAGGRLAGAISLRRAAGEASLESRLDFADMALDGPALSGRASGALDLAGTGKSEEALVASLAGSGRALLYDLIVPRADPAAVARAFAALDQDGQTLAPASVAALLARELKRADFGAKSSAFDIAVAAGVLRLSPAGAPEKPAPLLAASFDLSRTILSQRLSLPLDPAPKDFIGAPPQIALLFEGPYSSPRIEAAALANALAARAILRESARIEAFEFDIHERAFFYQRLRSERRREAERLRAVLAQEPANPAN